MDFLKKVAITASFYEEGRLMVKMDHYEKRSVAVRHLFLYLTDTPVLF
jgi:hypothetical protein